MSILGLFYFLGIAFLITTFLGYILSLKGLRGSIWTFVLVILFGVLAAQFWVTPEGSYFRDVYWLPPIVAGLFIALLLAALTPSSRTRQKLPHQSRKPSTGKSVAALALGGFFWLLGAIILIVAITGIVNTIA